MDATDNGSVLCSHISLLDDHVRYTWLQTCPMVVFVGFSQQTSLSSISVHLESPATKMAQSFERQIIFRMHTCSGHLLISYKYQLQPFRWSPRPCPQTGVSKLLNDHIVFVEDRVVVITHDIRSATLYVVLLYLETIEWWLS